MSELSRGDMIYTSRCHIARDFAMVACFSLASAVAFVKTAPLLGCLMGGIALFGAYGVYDRIQARRQLRTTPPKPS